uniref:Uncharacterized protein n=1 Tax=Nothobranchius furzeri TaxID=105023 RepID=A0A8C6VX15_NOTFU
MVMRRRTLFFSVLHDKRIISLLRSPDPDIKASCITIKADLRFSGLTRSLPDHGTGPNPSDSEKKVFHHFVFLIVLLLQSEEDDARSITASSIISVFQRVPMDPLEKDWLRSCTLGNVSVQRLLLAQDPNLVMKKTALHWAAKQGRLDSVDMMLHYGADVNVRSGYTALHLASIHGHQDIVQTLISSHNAKTNIRDYHGKMAIQYWTCTRPGTTSIFNQEPALSDGGRFSQERRTQRFALPSLRLSRSRSHGQLHLDFGALPSASCDALDLHV